jgi:hypothetical protein
VGEKNRLKEGSGQLGSKTHRFCPSESKTARLQASLSSSRNHARSAFKRFFHQLALAEQDYLLLGQKLRVFGTHWSELLRHTRCPALPDSLKEQLRKAKSSKVASSIPRLFSNYNLYTVEKIQLS